MDDHGARADDGARANFSPREGNRANPDMCERMHGHGAPQEDTGRKVHVVTDSTVVLDHGGSVHYAVLTDEGARIDHGPGHDDGPVLNSG